MHAKEWKINSKIIQGLSTSIKFLGFQYSGNGGNLTLNVKNKLLHVSLLATKRFIMYWSFLDFEGSIYCLWDYTSNPFTR